MVQWVPFSGLISLIIHFIGPSGKGRFEAFFSIVLSLRQASTPRPLRSNRLRRGFELTELN